jgi:rRNA maturation protein Nop10
MKQTMASSPKSPIELKKHFCTKHQDPETTRPHDVTCKLCKTKRRTNLATYTYCKECALFKERCSQCGNTVQPKSPSRGSPKGMKQDLNEGLFIFPISKLIEIRS